jgi:alpha-glucuronidase
MSVANATSDTGYEAWLRYDRLPERQAGELAGWCRRVVMPERDTGLFRTIRDELAQALAALTGAEPAFTDAPGADASAADDSGANRALLVMTAERAAGLGLLSGEEAGAMHAEGFVIRGVRREGAEAVLIAGGTARGLLYGVFHFLRLAAIGGLDARSLAGLDIADRPRNPLRMINHWDNMDGSIERGYAGGSIFYRGGRFVSDRKRIRDYARLLASIGINALTINNVNVHETETKLITDELLPDVAAVADIFREYGIRIMLSINFAAPIQAGGLTTADPLDPAVRAWWRERAADIYRRIPDFGGFLVKADSEFRPGPFTYGRDHADGANMLAEALEPFGGVVIWRCFVYNCLQDWRDRKTDRAKAAYDHFVPLDGRFRDNVLLQIKNGPMDFQVREPVSPLFGGLRRTNQMLELQITQEYTGQQRHLCYLVPQWKEVLDFDTHARGEGTTVARIVDGSAFGRATGGIAGVSNIGDDPNWTGHLLAQANLYGFGRLAWNPELTAEGVTDEWVRLTFGGDPETVRTIAGMLLDSWRIYENYTAPLGVGWMVNPGHHYGPNVDGYEYSKWGTYHFADCHGVGVDRTVKTGTGFTAQYHKPHCDIYESLELCPDELLLFFHHVPYTHRLKSGKTVIQHIYDTHFEGAEQARGLVERWKKLKDRIDPGRFRQVLRRLEEQAEHAEEWRDVINAYFWRKSGIPDERGRKMY